MKTPVWVVTNVEPQKDYTLILTFASGEKKLFDARPLLAKAIYKPFFLQLRLTVVLLLGMMTLILRQSTYMNAACLFEFRE